jgi:L-galactose dehydrogenase
MQYRQLGTTDLTVSILGFGASPLGDEFGAVDPKEGHRAVGRAIDLGINFFDVSPYYGRTLAEKRLGTFLAGRRREVVLASKVGRYDRLPPDGFDVSAARVTRSVEESLTRLRTDFIDLIQVHDVEFSDAEQIVGETLLALERLREQGKVRYIGITGYPLGVLKRIAGDAAVDTLLSYCHYNLANTTLDDALGAFARSRGIGLINASPLHKGLLTHRGPPAWHPAPPGVRAAAREAAAYCALQGSDLADLALRFALAYDGVASTFVGMHTVAEVERNTAAVGEEPEDTLLKAVRSIMDPVADYNWPSGRPENDDPD